MDGSFSFSNSREESFPDMIHNYTDDCIDVDALYHVSDTSNLKEELVDEEDFSPSLQEIFLNVFSPESEEKDQ